MYIVAKTHQKRVIMSCLLANMKGMYLTISAKLVTISVKSRLSLIPIQKKMSQAKKSLFRGYRYIHVSFYPGFTSTETKATRTCKIGFEPTRSAKIRSRMLGAFCRHVM